MGKATTKEGKAERGAEYFFPKFQKLAALYRKRFLEPQIRAHKNWRELETSPWESLRFFLEHYAFERQGRSPEYGPAAADAVAELTARSNPKNSSKLAKNVWEKFQDKMNRQNLNHMNNPVCPYDTRYTHKDGTKAWTRGLSAVEFVDETLHGQPMVEWAHQKVQRGEANEAHRALCGINGVRDKIASLFLRDVAISCNISGLSNESRRYLQPIDKWVRFVVRQLAEKEKTDTAKAKFIVEHTQKSANGNEPEEVNQGMWYFCVEVARSEYRVKQVFENHELFGELVKRHVRALREPAEAWRNNK